MRALVLAATFTSLASAAPLTHTLASPDGRHELGISFTHDGTLSYTLRSHGRALIAPSRLGLAFGAQSTVPAPNWQAKVIANRTHQGTWKPVWGKRSSVPDEFQETTLELTGPGTPIQTLRLTFRAYNDGVAFRYEIPAAAANQPARAAADLTEFNFAGDFTAWFYNGENHNLGPEKLSTITGFRLPVMTVQAADDAFLAIHEADLRSGEPLRLEKSTPTGFRALTAPGPIAPGQALPWRVIFSAKTPGAMVDSHLIELLNPDPAGDFSWVKPGLATWDWRIDGAKTADFTYAMNLPSWLRMVDFAAQNGMPHLVLDANWYGPEFNAESDPIKGDKARDVRKLIEYARTKNVGIWLYLNDVGGRQYPLQTLAQYGQWGAAGVKYGFMRGTPEEKNARTRRITELCAQHRLLCNFHDGPVHPYGQMRTWPNAVTREYNFAQLDAKKVFSPKTFVTAVFVNMLAGPLDMNNGMFDLRQGPTTRVDNNQPVPSTLVSEAARTLITFSGVTILPDIPEFYQKYPDLLAFLAAQKMPWRESRTLSGVIGDHIAMARQAADGTWLMAAAASEAGRDIELPLDFLPPGPWHATIVQDGTDAHYLHNRESLRSDQRTLTATDRIRLKLAPGGGATVLLKR